MKHEQVSRMARRTPGEPAPQGEQSWGSTTDKIKGRVKEAVGVITDNDRLKREGQTDQVVGEVKEAAEKVKDKVARVVEKVKDA